MQTVPQDARLQFVIFQVGAQTFGVEITRVREIQRYREITPLPKAPAFLEGVIEVRGSLILIVDLRKRFQISNFRNDSRTRIIILHSGGRRIGIVVDAVQRVLTIPLSDIKAPPAMAHSHGSDPIMAVAKYKNELFVILDLDRILTSSEKMTLTKVKLA